MTMPPADREPETSPLLLVLAIIGLMVAFRALSLM